MIGEDLDSEASRGQAEKLWLVHQEGFSAANVVKENKLGMNRTPSGGFDLDEKCKIQIGNAMQIVDGEYLEKVNNKIRKEKSPDAFLVGKSANVQLGRRSGFAVLFE